MVSAVAVRFVFPAVSLEGESFWIIRSSPLPLKEFLWAKFWSSLLPLLVLAEVLTVLSNTLLKVTPFMMALGIVTVLLMTFGITALGVGLGAVFPRFKVENAAQIPTGFGGIVYMLLTMIFIGVVVTLEAWPVYRIFTAQTMGKHISPSGWFGIGFSLRPGAHNQYCSLVSAHARRPETPETKGNIGPNADFKGLKIIKTGLKTTTYCMYLKINTLPCNFLLYKSGFL